MGVSWSIAGSKTAMFCCATSAWVLFAAEMIWLPARRALNAFTLSAKSLRRHVKLAWCSDAQLAEQLTGKTETLFCRLSTIMVFSSWFKLLRAFWFWDEMSACCVGFGKMRKEDVFNKEFWRGTLTAPLVADRAKSWVSRVWLARAGTIWLMMRELLATIWLVLVDVDEEDGESFDVEELADVEDDEVLGG